MHIPSLLVMRLSNMIFTSDYLRQTKKVQWRTRFFVVGMISSVVLMGSYFIYQMRDWIFLPELTVQEPADGATFWGPAVIIQGITTPGTRLTVEGVEAYSGKNGEFRVDLLLPNGFHVIDIVAENRFGRKSVLERKIVVKEAGSKQ